MGWVWKDEEDDANSPPSVRSGDISKFGNPNSGNEDRCSTRKIVKSQCKTEEVEPGKFVRKCEKTEQILKECVGRWPPGTRGVEAPPRTREVESERLKPFHYERRPTEVVQSNKEYTEDDVTDEVMKGSFSSGSSDLRPFDFPGLRDDIEAIERSFFGNLGRFFDAAEEMKNGFFNAIGSPHLHDRESSSSPSVRRGIPIEGHPQKDDSPESNNPDSGDVDLAGLARDV